MERDRRRPEVSHGLGLDERVDRQSRRGTDIAGREGGPGQARLGHRVILAVVEAFEVFERLSQVGGRCVDLAAVGAAYPLTPTDGEDPSAPGRSGRTALVAELPKAFLGLVDERQLQTHVVTGAECDMTEVEVPIGDARLIAGRLGDVDLCLVVATRSRRVGLPVGETSGRTQRPRSVGSGGRCLGHRQRLLGKLTTIGDLPERLPEPPQGGGQAKSEDSLPGIDRPTDRRTKVGLLRRHAIEPFAVTRRVRADDSPGSPGRGKPRRGADARRLRCRHSPAGRGRRTGSSAACGTSPWPRGSVPRR